MLREGRKQPRTPERFLVQISAVHDPLLEELAVVRVLLRNGFSSLAPMSMSGSAFVE